MSLFPRQLIPEIRTALRLLEEPLLRSPTLNPRYASQYPHLANIFAPLGTSPFNEPTFREEGNNYLIQAELPGVKKENLSVEFAEGGEVLHIKGSKGERRQAESTPVEQPPVEQPAASTSSAEAADASAATTTSAPATDVPTSSEATPASPWAAFSAPSAENYNEFSNSFRFAKPVDVEKVQAKYEDGVLRLVIPKREKDTARKAVNIL